MSENLIKSRETIDQIRCLPENWNGNGAPAFSDVLLNLAAHVAEKSRLQPNIFPTARNSIQLEYENDAEDYLEFELFEDGKIKMFLCKYNGESAVEYITANKIGETVDKFYRTFAH